MSLTTWTVAVGVPAKVTCSAPAPGVWKPSPRTVAVEPPSFGPRPPSTPNTTGPLRWIALGVPTTPPSKRCVAETMPEPAAGAATAERTR